jgi:hypothetical protein
MPRPPGHPRIRRGDGGARRAVAGQSDRSLDQLVLDYLASGEMPEEVEVALTPKPEFVSGRSFQAKLKATDGIAGACAARAIGPGPDRVDLGAVVDRVPGQDRPDGAAPSPSWSRVPERQRAVVIA